jgi:hypothetical protein
MTAQKPDSAFGQNGEKQMAESTTSSSVYWGLSKAGADSHLYTLLHISGLIMSSRGYIGDCNLSTWDQSSFQHCASSNRAGQQERM